MGCRPAAGYMGTTLFWMAVNKALPGEPFSASFLPDFVVARLTGTLPVTDPTNAAGTGLFDVLAMDYHDGLLERLGLSRGMLPEVVPSATEAGRLAREAADATGLGEGIPVTVACGDNQASFAGSVSDYEACLAINVGTGGQVSCHAGTSSGPEVAGKGELEARPYMDGGFLWVGAGLVGGRTYAWLRNFFREVGQGFFSAEGDEALYDAMSRLAKRIPAGADGLRCEPLLSGTRQDPDRRGIWKGVGTANFTPGHMVRALLEGIADQFRDLYGEMEALGAGGRTRLIGAGNGIRKNRLLRSILAERFAMRMEVPVHTEEAAYGAALVAAVNGGAFASLAESGKIIRYEEG